MTNTSGKVLNATQSSRSFTFVPPILSLKLFNFAEQPIDVSEIRIDVDSSSVDKEPILSTSGAILPYGHHLSFDNDDRGE